MRNEAVGKAPSFREFCKNPSIFERNQGVERAREISRTFFMHAAGGAMAALGIGGGMLLLEGTNYEVLGVVLGGMLGLSIAEMAGCKQEVVSLGLLMGVGI